MEVHADPEGATATDDPSGPSDGGFGASRVVESLELYRAGLPGAEFESQERHVVLNGVGDVSLGNNACKSATSRQAKDPYPIL